MAPSVADQENIPKGDGRISLRVSFVELDRLFEQGQRFDKRVLFGGVPFGKSSERKVGLASDLLEGAAGKTHAAQLAFVLDPSRNVDAVAEDIVAVDDNIANIDPDTERASI